MQKLLQGFNKKNKKTFTDGDLESPGKGSWK